MCILSRFYTAFPKFLSLQQTKHSMHTPQIEKTLWATADKLRSNMDAAEYKHVVPGLIFLKYISEA